MFPLPHLLLLLAVRRKSTSSPAWGGVGKGSLLSLNISCFPSWCLFWQRKHIAKAALSNSGEKGFLSLAQSLHIP